MPLSCIWLYCLVLCFFTWTYMNAAAMMRRIITPVTTARIIQKVLPGPLPPSPSPPPVGPPVVGPAVDGIGLAVN